MKHAALFILLALPVLLSGCRVVDEKDKEARNMYLPPVYPEIYTEPSVSADRSKLLFIRNKVTQVGSFGNFKTDPDSSGIWLAESDGSNMRLLIQGQNMGAPHFSPDMNWIVFGAGAQIHKVPFTGGAADMENLEQLTFEGRNYDPVWSPDGKWIAYNRSLEDEAGPAGIWLMDSDGEQKKNLFGGAFPAWQPDGTSILAVVGTSSTSVWKRFKKFLINDELTEIMDAVIDADNRYPKYSPDGRRIAFQSDGQVWLMEADGSNPRLLQKEAQRPVWRGNEEIIFADYNPHRFSKSNGTLWIINTDGSGKRQLTFNYGLELGEEF